jgi:chemotaxis protein MotD
MTKTDPLMAMIRQLTGGKAASRKASHPALVAKDHKGKLEAGKSGVERFHDQLRAVAQGTKHVSRPDNRHANAEATQDMAPPRNAADVESKVTIRPRERDRTRPHAAEVSADRVSGEAVPTPPPEWRTPDAALSSVMSKLDQALSSREDSDAPRAPHAQVRTESRALQPDPDEPMKLSTEGTREDTRAGQRFASSPATVETRPMPIVKVAIREQETHFQPVGQPTLLQKIVDRIAPDLTAPSGQPAATAADVTASDMRSKPDAPIRMLTLQLDPPSMGTVTVRMRLTGDAVEVRLSADRPETIQLLREERSALTDAMRSAGYTFEIASIDHGGTGHLNLHGGQSHAQSDQQQSQQPQGGSQLNNANHGASERQSDGAQAGARHNRQGHDEFTKPGERPQDEETVLNRNNSTLYL